MALIKSFTDLEVWREAHKLTLLVYKDTESFPKSEMFGLTSQLRRAAISIESCIAEGFSRFHFRDRLNFYYDARGSISEVQSQSITAKDLEYFNSEKFQKIFDQAQKAQIILSGLVRSTENLAKNKKSA